MDAVADAFHSYVELPLMDLGLFQNRGARFGVFTTLTATSLFLIQPSGLFDQHGNMRPTSIISSSEDAVLFSLPVISLGVGFASLLFI